jgi:hypothetical protein
LRIAVAPELPGVTLPPETTQTAPVVPDVINAHMGDAWIDNSVAAAKKDPNAPFADARAALERLLTAGANRRDISLVARLAIYEAVFSLLYMLDDPGVDDNDCLHAA